MALPMRNSRVRLCFDDPPPHHPRLVLYLVNLEKCKFVSDLESQIKSRFSLSRHTHVHLYVDEYLLPSNERIEVIRDNDAIRVLQEPIQYDLHSQKSNQKRKRKSATNISTEEEKDKPMTNGEITSKSCKKRRTKEQKEESHGRNKKENSQKQSEQTSSTKDEKTKKKKNLEQIKRKRKQSSSSSSDSDSYSDSDSDSSSDEERVTEEYNHHGNKKKRKTEPVQQTPTISKEKIQKEKSSPKEKVPKKSCLPNKKLPKEKGQSSVVDKNSKTNTGNHRDELNSPANIFSVVGNPGIQKSTIVRKNMKSSTDTHIRFESDSESDSESNSKATSKETTSKNTTSQSKKKQSSESSSSSDSSSSSSDSESECETTFSEKQRQAAKLSSANHIPPKKSTPTISAPANELTAKKSPAINPVREINSQIYSRHQTTEERFENNSKPAWNKGKRYQLGKQEQLNTILTNKSIIIEYPGEEAVAAVNSDYSNVPPPPAQRDYDKLQSLHGPPRVGDKIAYKILELSATYNPEISEYKEAIVTSFIPQSQELELEITHDPSLSGQSGPGKFDLVYDDDEDDTEADGNENDVSNKVTVSWSSMIEPKLVT